MYIDAHHRTIGPISTIRIHCLSFCEMHLPKNNVFDSAGPIPPALY